MIIQTKNKMEHNPKWLHILDHPYRTVVAGGLDQEKQMRCLIY